MADDTPTIKLDSNKDQIKSNDGRGPDLDAQTTGKTEEYYDLGHGDKLHVGADGGIHIKELSIGNIEHIKHSEPGGGSIDGIYRPPNREYDHKHPQPSNLPPDTKRSQKLVERPRIEDEQIEDMDVDSVGRESRNDVDQNQGQALPEPSTSERNLQPSAQQTPPVLNQPPEKTTDLKTDKVEPSISSEASQPQKPTTKTSTFSSSTEQTDGTSSGADYSKAPPYDAPIQSISSGDPRKMLAQEADEYLQIGQKIGSLLFWIWFILSIVGTFGFIVSGIIPTVILNLLLISPKTVYKITEWILDLIGVGEVMQALDTAGLDQVKITIKTWHKVAIIVWDIILGLIITVIIFFITAAIILTIQRACNTGPTSIIIRGASYVSTKLGLIPLDICTEVNQLATSLGLTGGLGGGGGGPIVASGCENKESGDCTRANISACSGMAAQMDNALRICNQESGGGKSIPSSTDKCLELTTGKVISFSWGLWQINVENSASEYPECNGVLRHVAPGSYCSVSAPYGQGPYNGADCTCRYGPGGEAAFKVCTDALIRDPARNTAQACTLFNQPGPHHGIREWGPWQTSAQTCKIPGY